MQNSVLPQYQTLAQEMLDELYREMSSEMIGLKKEVISWQSSALESQEVSDDESHLWVWSDSDHQALIRDMDSSIRTLSAKVEALTSLLASPQPPPAQYYNGGVSDHQPSGPPPLQSHLRPQPPPQPQQAPVPTQVAPWHSSSSTSSLSSTPPVPPFMTNMNNVAERMILESGSHLGQNQNIPAQSQQQGRQSGGSGRNWDQEFVDVLMTKDGGVALRRLLKSAPIDTVLPTGGTKTPMNGLWILALIFQLASHTVLGEHGEDADTCIWWLQRAVSVLQHQVRACSPVVCAL